MALERVVADLVVGVHPEFDDAFVIKGNSEPALRRFFANERLRELLQNQPSVHFEVKDYRVTAGFGLRFVVPMFGPVPIALDFGFPIIKAEHDNNQVFSFWLGFFR